MIEVRIPGEITEYKEKLFFNLNLRQTICSALVISINVPLYIFGQKYINDDALSLIVIGIAIPIFFAGFFKYNSLNFESFLMIIIKYNFIYPQFRAYKIKNMYEILLEDSEKNKSKAKSKI